MSELQTAPDHPLNTGGYSFSVVTDAAVLLILGYFAVHTVQKAGELLTADRASVVAWLPVVVASAIMLVVIPLIVGRLWSQLSTRYTTQGISQWRFLSYRSLDWPDVVRVYYDRHGIILEGQTRAIRIIASCYRRPDEMHRVVHAHLSSAASQTAREQLSSAARGGASELRREGSQASSA
jgi:hypothetical protein